MAGWLEGADDARRVARNRGFLVVAGNSVLNLWFFDCSYFFSLAGHGLATALTNTQKAVTALIKLNLQSYNRYVSIHLVTPQHLPPLCVSVTQFTCFEWIFPVPLSAHERSTCRNLENPSTIPDIPQSF